MRALRRLRRVGGACLAVLFAVELGVAIALFSGAVWPELGDARSAKGGMTVDRSHASDGYIQVCAEPTNQKLKLRISCGDMTYTYDLNGAGEYEVFPLQMGSGRYVCSLYENIRGNKYFKRAEIGLDAELTDENAAFLCPNQYVNYSADSPAVAASNEICAGLETDREKLDAIREFMTRGFCYDYIRALTATSDYLGDVDGCFETRMGLCQDLAAVAACMLRVQGIPTQLVIGYAGDDYHAWNSVLIDGEYQRLDITAALSGFSADTVYTAERRY